MTGPLDTPLSFDEVEDLGFDGTLRDGRLDAAENNEGEITARGIIGMLLAELSLAPGSLNTTTT